MVKTKKQSNTDAEIVESCLQLIVRLSHTMHLVATRTSGRMWLIPIPKNALYRNPIRTVVEKTSAIPGAQCFQLTCSNPLPISKNDQAALLIRAMINSAKVDGEISDDEQRRILEQVGDTSPETIQFLRVEFARPFDVYEYN
ncbi:MAG TPA: DUF533 domain-containing protein [Pirellula sp.]|nr:DUF533 domain-containing protein [Pirellula sp.]